MNCPNCGTPNDPASLYCIKCGQSLAAAPTLPVSPLASPSPHLLIIFSIRLVITLLFLWLIRSILLQLPFTQGILLPPDIPLTVSQIITSITYLLILLLLLGYAQALWSLWPQAFPRAAGFTSLVAAVVYLVALPALYSALAQPLLLLAKDPNILLWFQVFLLVVAAALLAWSGLALYSYLPTWLGSFRFDMPSTVLTEVACPHCGRPNPATMNYCGNCGQPLKPQTAAAADAPAR